MELFLPILSREEKTILQKNMISGVILLRTPQETSEKSLSFVECNLKTIGMNCCRRFLNHEHCSETNMP